MNFILWTVQTLLKIYLVIYLFFHACGYFYPGFVKYMVFMNNVKLPFTTYENPTEYGLKNVHNFYFNSEPDVKIGVWHYMPEKLGYKFDDHKHNSVKDHLSKFLKQTSNTPQTIVFYAHGNDQDRVSRFRRELCTNLANMGYHVFALDYRGYGDSTGSPTEKGVVKDLLELYELVKTHANENTKLFLYGHSLGTGVVSHASKILTNKNAKLDGVILEAPFLNASLAGKDYIVSLLFNNNKWIQGRAEEGLVSEGIAFNNDKHILDINTRMLIFHAEDDWFIPHYHGVTLHEISKSRPKHFPEVKFVTFEREHGLGHFLQSHKNLYTHIKKLIDG